MNGLIEEYPYPQTIGRVRNIETVAPVAEWNWPYRVTSPGAESLWKDYGFTYELKSEAVRKQESTQAAASTGGGGGGIFETIGDLLGTFGGAAKKTSTIADQIMENWGLKVQSVSPGSKVSGSPPAPTITNYGVANNVDRKIKDIKTAGEAVLNQIKGLFNLSYEGPYDPKATPQTGVATVPSTGMPSWLPIAGLALLIFIVSRK